MMLACMYVHHVVPCASGCQKRVMDLLELELWPVVSCHVVWRTDLEFSARAVNALTCWAIAPAPKSSLYITSAALWDKWDDCEKQTWLNSHILSCQEQRVRSKAWRCRGCPRSPFRRRATLEAHLTSWDWATLPLDTSLKGNTPPTRGPASRMTVT